MNGLTRLAMARLVAGVVCVALSASVHDQAIAQEGIPEGFMIIEGDILVPEDFNRGTYATNLWTNGVVPYVFDSNVTPEQQSMAVFAMQQWEAAATVDFRPRNNEFNHIYIVADPNANFSMVGMWPLLGQPVHIFNWDYPFVIAHELGHALGFWHEQSRVDRDDYVTINWALIRPGDENNFQIRGDQGPQGSGEYGPYDFDSVMHYGACASTICCTPGEPCDCTPICQTILLDPPNQGQVIGQRDHLSVWDRITMSFLYSQANWRFVDITATGNQTGSFVEPYHQFEPGYGNTPSGGTLWVQPGSYLAGGVHSIPMIVRAPLGGVTLGN